MAAPSVTVEPAGEADLDRVEALLDECDLPSGDVRTSPGSFYVATVDAAVVAVGGLERYGSVGLLRSVAVAEPRRGRGYGAAVCDELESIARESGVAELYLLTTTASAFFERRGYEEVARAAAPARVRRSTQFADLCPASATCMRKRLR